MADLLPPAACAFVVPAAETAAPTCFIGLAVHGEDAALRAFLEQLRRRKIIGDFVEGEQPPEVMALFVGTGRADALTLFREALAGRFGKLDVEVVVAPASAAHDGLDMDTEIRVAPSDYLKSALE